MKTLRLFTVLMTAVTLIACSEMNHRTIQPTLVGSDRDSHGCIASAGYTWCKKTNQCERPWEVAQRQSFENTAEAFAQFCSTP